MNAVDGRVIENLVGGRLTYWARGEETGDALTLVESIVTTPGAGPPLHVHMRADEFVYVLEGGLRFRIEESVQEAPAGSFLFIRRNVPHTWQNAGEDRVRFLFGFTPASPDIERFFERAAELPADGRLALAFERFAGDADIEVVGPPLVSSLPTAGPAGVAFKWRAGRPFG